MRGDGTLELTSMAGPSKAPPVVAEENISSFSVQTFAEVDSVSWDRSSALTKLLTIASVCNKAKFVYSDDASGKRATRCCLIALTVDRKVGFEQTLKPAHRQLPMLPCPGSSALLLTWLLVHCVWLCAAANKSPDHTAVTVPMFKGGVDDRKTLGDATDSGLLRYCDKLAPSGLVRMAYKKVSRVVKLD
jgi:hypothetical protein